jgi:hypothetical protein
VFETTIELVKLPSLLSVAITPSKGSQDSPRVIVTSVSAPSKIGAIVSGGGGGVSEVELVSDDEGGKLELELGTTEDSLDELATVELSKLELLEALTPQDTTIETTANDRKVNKGFFILYPPYFLDINFA